MLSKLAMSYEMAKGAIGYFRFPDQKGSWGGPFNGQSHRTKMFHELQAAFAFRTIVETGTYRGTTTELFASVPGARVYTVESGPWSYGYCRTRFFSHPNVTLMWGDSRDALRKLSRRALPAPIFFYLDAHWNEDLPLAAELDIIFANWSDSIVMIDDFKVEGDDRYEFDDYGEQKRLNVDYLRSVINRFAPSLYFPSIRAEDESGARRGSVVILGRDLARTPMSFSTLRPYT